MIRYQWHDDVSGGLAADLAALLEEAAAYDAEAGFSTADPVAPPPEGATAHHLLVTMPPKGSRGSPDLDALPDVGAVAYLRLDLRGRVGEVQLVVHREFRSRGVATLLFEKLAEEPGGWMSIAGLERVRGWAHGSHPAAERLAWRFGATETARLHKTICLLGGRTPFVPRAGLEAVAEADVGEIGEELPGHDRSMAPADHATRERLTTFCSVTSGARVVVGPRGEESPLSPAPVSVPGAVADKDDIEALLSGAMDRAQADGARIVQLYVEADDELLLHVSRELGFFHDQDDCVYEHSVTPQDRA